MAEPQKMVHLTPVQRRRRKFYHHLIDNLPPHVSTEQLNQLLSTYFEAVEGSELHIETGKKLMENYLRLLRSIVARYLYHWPVTRRLLDEMISTGTVAIVKTIRRLKTERLDKKSNFKSLSHLIDNAVRHNIETVVNDFRGIAPAPERTNREREAKKQKPIYGNVDIGLTDDSVKDSQAYNDIDSFTLELEDAIEKIAQTEVEKQILARENWGLSNPELGKKLGRSARWVLDIRGRLRERYRKLGETL